jgi:hypothetical protein
MLLGKERLWSSEVQFVPAKEGKAAENNVFMYIEYVQYNKI